MKKYIVIDKDGYIVGRSELSGKVKHASLVPHKKGVNTAGKMFRLGKWVADDRVIAKSRLLSRAQFFDLFTDIELENILDGRKASKKLTAFVKRIEVDEQIDMTSKRLINGVNKLEALGVIAKGRAAEILA